MQVRMCLRCSSRYNGCASVEFEGCTMRSLEQKLAADTHFQIQGHALEIFGICPSCQG